MTLRYFVELMWNREFHFVNHGGPFVTLDGAIACTKTMENMGDGECVKKTRIVDDYGRVVFENGQVVPTPDKETSEPQKNDAITPLRPYRAWVNQPSTLQPYNYLHGTEGVCFDDFERSRFTTFYYADGNVLCQQSMPKLCISKGEKPR
jgi:hypothetical protein